jgi:hypothetical protein
MTDRFDEMRVPPDPVLAEELRHRLHARMAVASRDHEGRSHLDLDTARIEPLRHRVPTEENYMTVDSTSESRNRGEGTNRRRMGMAAAAVIGVIGVAGIALAINNTSEDDDEAPSPAVQPTVAATTTVAPTPGTFVMSGVRLTFAVPAGWSDNDWYVDKLGSDPSFGVVFNHMVNIYRDSCFAPLVYPPVGPTVDDLASAWADLPGFDATAPIDITVDGFHGKQVEFTVPDYDEEVCKDGMFKLTSSGDGDWWAQGPNQHNQVWILDINGTRIVIIAAYFPDTSPQDRAAIDEILASIQIG